MPGSFDLLGYLRRSPPPGIGAERTDAELLDAFVTRRDEVAFTVLMRRHAGMVFGVAQRLLGPGPDTEDVFQTVFLVFLSKADCFSPRAGIGAWLHEVAVRVALQARRQRLRWRRQQRPFDTATVPTRDDPLPTYDLAALLDAELLKLPEAQRGLIIACDLQQMSRKEAARQFGLAEGTVSSRLARARERLRSRLARRGLLLPASALAAALASNSAVAVPTLLTAATAKAAQFFAAGAGAVDQAAGPAVVKLMKGALLTMFLNKCKAVATGTLIAAVLLGSAASWTYRVLAQPGERVGGKHADAAAPPAAAPKDRPPKVPAENKLPTLLKDRRAAASQEYEARWQEFQGGRGTLDLLLNVALRLLKSDLDLARTPRDRIAAHEKYVKRMKEVVQIQEDKFNAGRVSIADFAQAKYYLLDGEIGIERERAR